MRSLEAERARIRVDDLSVTIAPALRQRLRTAADQQFRSMSSQAVKYITDGLIRDGYIILTPAVLAPTAQRIEEREK